MNVDPLTPPDCDLRDFSWMPLDVIRLRDSDLTVLLSAEAFRAAVLLWCAAWHQIPAASLPNDERILAKLAGYGRDVESWAKIRDDALHGFVECSDGRLYHPVVAEKALEADGQRKKQKERTQKATEARRGGNRNAESDDNRDVERNDSRGDRELSNRDGSRNVVQQTRPNQTKTKTTTEPSERVPPAIETGPPAPPSETLSPVSPPAVQESPKPKRQAPQRASGLQVLGTELPADWTPDESTCEACRVDFGMTDDDLRTELPAFHALNVQNATFSADWNKTFYLFCKRWKEHRDKQPAPRVNLNRAAAPAGRIEFTEQNWDGIVKFYATTGRWARDAGPDPMSPACRAPRHILGKHGINLETGERQIPPRNLPA